MNVKMYWLWAATLLIGGGAAAAADEPQPALQAAPAVGDALPAFESTDEQGAAWKSTDHVGKRVLVLYFYPGDFTGGCIKQAQAYRDALAKIEELGAEVVGVSGDEAGTHRLFKESYGLTHSLLADTKGDLGKLLGVPVSPGGRVQPRGPDGKPLVNGAGERIVVERPVTLARWTLVVDREGKIVSLRNIVNAVTDSEEVRKIVADLPK